MAPTMASGPSRANMACAMGPGPPQKRALGAALSRAGHVGSRYDEVIQRRDLPVWNQTRQRQP